MSKYTPVANPMSHHDRAVLSARSQMIARCARHNAAMYARRAERAADAECEIEDDPAGRRTGWGYAEQLPPMTTTPRGERTR